MLHYTVYLLGHNNVGLHMPILCIKHTFVYFKPEGWSFKNYK